MRVESNRFGALTAYSSDVTLQTLTRRVDAAGPLTAEPVLWLVVASVAGLAVGAAVSVSPLAAVVLAAGIALLVWVMRRPELILMVLFGSVFVQVITVSGVTIGRLCGPIALIVVAVSMLRGTATLRLAPPLVWSALYALWAVASGMWTVDLGGTMTQLGSLAIALSYLLAFATLLTNWREMDRVLYVVAVLALCVGLFGIAAQGRAGTNVGDANFFAMIELVALPLVLSLAARTEAQWARFGLYGVVLVIVGAVFSSLSRGGLIALGAIVLGVTVLPWRTFFRSPRQKLIVLLVLVIAVFGAYKMTSQALSARVEAVFTSQGQTGSGRLNAWRAAYTSIQRRPFDGLGYGAFQSSANELMLSTSGVDLSNFRLRPNGLFAHSAYIGTAAELGIPGLVLFLGLLISTGTTLRRIAGQADESGAVSTRRLANALLVSLVGWSVAAIFLSAETSRSIWILIGITLSLPKLLEAEIAQPAEAGMIDE